MEKVDKLYSYVVMHDTGFAPNPFFGYCTLACCKPTIRRVVGQNFDNSVATWVVGVTPNRSGNLLLYAMRVDEVMSFAQYYYDKRFYLKQPSNTAGVVRKCGDNIYKPIKKGYFLQLRSTHSNPDGTENVENKVKDVDRGKYILISSHFWYFGRQAIKLPFVLKSVSNVGRGHRSKFESSILASFAKFISKQNGGVQGSPTVWPENDDSWIINSYSG